MNGTDGSKVADIGGSGTTMRRPGDRWAVTLLVGLGLAVTGCGDSSRSPSAPAAAPPAASWAAPTVTSIVPALGSSSGGSEILISGTGFKPGTTATFDNITVAGLLDLRDSTFSKMRVTAPPHAVGVVDVLVTGPDGQSQRVTAAYTYAAPESFDMNGTWDGISINGTDTAIHFVIQNNRLVSAACSYDVYMPYPLVEFPAAAGGEFAVTLPGGQAISGRIVSAWRFATRVGSWARC